MQKQSQLMQELRPWIVDLVSQLTRGQASANGGSAALIVHDIASPWHSGTLRDDQAPQFLLRSGVRSLTGNLAVDSGVTIDGIDISAHAADPNAHHAQIHDLVSGNHTASGLTTGHVVRASGATTFAFAQLQHTDLGGVTADQHHAKQHGITDAANHTVTGAQWQLVGLTGTNALGLLTPNANPGAAIAILASDATGMLTLPIFTATTRVRSPLIDAAANLSIQPAGDLTIDPTGGEVFIPGNRTVRSSAWTPGLLGTGWGIQERASGKSHLDIRSIYTDELIATTFTADQVRVRSGSDWLGESMAIAARDNSDAKVTIPNVGGGSVRIYVENAPEISGQIFDANEYVLIKTIDRSTGLVIRETWGQVSSYVSETGNRQSYAWTTVSGGGNFLLEPGTALIGFGVSGGSYIYRTVIEAGRGPYERFATWATNPYTPANRTSRVEIGDIKNAAGDSTTRYGIAAGNNLALTSTTGFSGFTADNVGGMSIFNADFYLKDSGETVVSLKRTTGLDFKAHVELSPSSYTRQIMWWDSIDSPTTWSGRIYSSRVTGGSPSNFLQIASDHEDGILNRVFVSAYSNVNYAASLDLWSTPSGPSVGSKAYLSAGSIYFSNLPQVWNGSAGAYQSMWYAGNFTPGNYALLSGATFTGGIQTTGILTVGEIGTNAKQLYFNIGTAGNGYGIIQSLRQGIDYTHLALNPDGGRVGIGTVAPNGTLDVKVATNQHFQVSNLSGVTFLSIANDANNANTSFRIDASQTVFGAGNVGIGTTGPSQALDVALGNISVGTGANSTYGIYLGYAGYQASIIWNSGNGNLEITPRSGYATSIVSGNLWVGNSSDLYGAKIQTSGNIHSSAAITAEGYLQVKAASTPATASGWARIFLRSSDNALCAVMPSGNVRVIVAN